MKNTYEDRIQNTMNYLKTPLPTWSVIPFKMVMSDNKLCPQTDFSYTVGYTFAPIENPQDDTCELCGHNIKNVYWIKHDVKKWIMRIGSECITHFGPGISGRQIAAGFQYDTKFTSICDIILRLKDIRDIIRQEIGNCFKFDVYGSRIIGYRNKMKKLDYNSKSSITRLYNSIPEVQKLIETCNKNYNASI